VSDDQRFNGGGGGSAGTQDNVPPQNQRMGIDEKLPGLS